MENSNPRLQIIRGLPGSGKTTLAIARFPQLMRLETDMFFYREGAYRFTLENNQRAVGWFRKAIREFCNQGFDFVTTGVFSAHTERLQDTIAIAVERGYEVYIKTLTSRYKGIHAVPKEHYDAMRQNFVAEKVLRDYYKNEPQIHFGLMPVKYPLEHLTRESARKMPDL